ncbi:MAG: hypothetical protein LAN64_14655 [Acidobacteriia bacterium]|nr:hypothetical protein [Terriglobia bacterium]
MTRYIVTRYVIAALVALLVAPSASAQGAPDLRRLARDAGLIFSGTVTRIEHVAPAARGDIGVVRVTFRVSDALRGATPGEALTISEWDGLWTAGDRYRVGENLLLFLYPPSGDLGLTTPVGGEQGRISLADSQLSIAAVARLLADATPALPEKPRPTRSPQRQARGRAQE